MDLSAVPSRISSTLTRKVGPLPVWGWGLAAVGAVIAVRLVAGRRGGSTAAAGPVGPLPPNALWTPTGAGGGDGTSPPPLGPVGPYRSHSPIPAAPATPSPASVIPTDQWDGLPPGHGKPTDQPQQYYDIYSHQWFWSKSLPAPFFSPTNTPAEQQLAETSNPQAMSYKDWYRKYVIGGG